MVGGDSHTQGTVDILPHVIGEESIPRVDPVPCEYAAENLWLGLACSIVGRGVQMIAEHRHELRRELAQVLAGEGAVIGEQSDLAVFGSPPHRRNRITPWLHCAAAYAHPIGLGNLHTDRVVEGGKIDLGGCESPGLRGHLALFVPPEFPQLLEGEARELGHASHPQLPVVAVQHFVHVEDEEQHQASLPAKRVIASSSASVCGTPFT